MENSWQKILQGYYAFRRKYALGRRSSMAHLSQHGQRPQIMIVSCCDSRVDPALILQCDPGDLFVVRNVANIIPPYETEGAYHGTSAALEFGVCLLNAKYLILLGHSQCGGIQALLKGSTNRSNDFINNWVSIIKRPPDACQHEDPDEYAKEALHQSYQNCLTFPWINQKVLQGQLHIHLWFFDIKTGQILSYCREKQAYCPLDHGLDIPTAFPDSA